MSRSTADSASSVTLPTPKERRRLRKALALSEEQVAGAMGVTKATVRSWETGRSAPRGRKREAYAKLLGAFEPDGPPSTENPAGAGPSGAEKPAKAEKPTEAEKPTAAEKPAKPQPPSPVRAQAPAPSANVRPKAAAKRAAKPPKAPSPSPSLSPSPSRRADPRPQERLKPVAAQAPAPEPVRPATPALPAVPGLTPEEAFDALYAHAAPGLVHQTYLLSGRRQLSREAVEHAFHHAWEHWPEVAVDPDPVGWVRATAYEYALSPWHRLRRAHRHPDAPPTEANRRALLTALLELPPPYRRTVLLYDGLGLDLPETAAETEASTPAAANRLLHARTVLGERVPELAEPEALHQRLSALVTEAPTATLPAARAVRTGSERRTRTWTRAVLGVTAVLIGVTGFTAATAPTRYIPVNAPGETVNGVPVRGGPQKLRPEDVELRDRLRAEPNPGPERLVPAAE
ncbi:sigma factor-like helix-turn-helix DNA-binding protein [Streptomyces venezuelae]|uniref:sigma factor-like helix-turn-helix DNA-binding protein n=1 Tax=Streptomyces venezuelae TaxID=54571 RepID=UPI00278C0642|nr:sigma factor-like helix-turn-helix DNA-binding protein [Streptomyces venezuelae]